MKRVLFFTPYFLPRRRVGAMRPFRFVIHLKEFGWEPVVLCIAAKGQQLTKKEAELLAGIEIIELQPPFDRTISSESQLKPYQNEKNREVRSGKQNRLIHAFDRNLPVDSWLFFFLTQYGKIKKVIERVEPDILFSTGNPWSSLVLGGRLAKCFDLPYVADFRDPWTLCKTLQNKRWPVSIAIDKALERKIVKTADLLLFTAHETEKKYRRHYADIIKTTQTITNSFDLAWMKSRSRYHPKPLPTPNAFNIGFFGKFRQMSPASLIIDLLAFIKQKDPQSMRNINIYSYGSLNEEDQNLAGQKGVSACFHQRDAVPLENAIDELQIYDILLISSERARNEIIPAKLMEYLASGLPVLSLSSNPEVGEILTETGTGLQFDTQNLTSAAEFLVKYCRKKIAGKGGVSFPFQPKPEKVAQFEARETTRQLSEIFNRLI